MNDPAQHANAPLLAWLGGAVVAAFTVAAVAPDGWQQVLTVVLIVLVGVAAPFVYGAAHRWWRTLLLIFLAVVVVAAGIIALWRPPAESGTRTQRASSSSDTTPQTTADTTPQATPSATSTSPSPSPTFVSKGETRVLSIGTLTLAANNSWLEKKSGLRIAVQDVYESFATVSISTDAYTCDADPRVGESIVMTNTKFRRDLGNEYDRWYRVVVIALPPPTSAEPEKVLIEWSVGTGEMPVASAFGGSC